MSMVVQATCPGCKQVLRIPSEWLGQPFRCKHCHTIIQANAPPPPSRRPGPASPTPPPVSRAIRQAVKPPPVPVPPVPVAKAPPPAPMAVPVAAPAGAIAPMAIPVATVPPGVTLPVAGSAFNGIDEAAPGLGRRRRRAPWLPLLIGLVLLGGSAAATVHFWPQIAPLFEKKGNVVVQNDDEKKPDPTPPTDDKKTTEGPKTTREPTPKATTPKTTTTTPKDGATKPDPNKDRPKPDPNKDRPKPDPNKDKTRPKPFDGSFPRRALVIGVHNYLFANPVSAGDQAGNGRNMQNFTGQLSQTRSWRISPSQTAFLSDAARPPRHQPHSPIKSTIEATVVEFLKTSRPADRIVLMFVGHGVELNGKGYLAPIEGDLTAAASLIPLEWLYQQLEACPAKQKLLVVDICRSNPARGEERPGSGPMGAKFDLALKNPPAGVQVWTACTEGQQSYEIEDGQMNNGVFMDSLYQVSVNGIEGTLQKPDDPWPLALIVERVNQSIKQKLGPRKLEQVSRLSGTPKEGGANFNPEDKPAPEPLVMAEKKKTQAEAALVRALFKELDVPPIKKAQQDGLLRFESMPPFPADVLARYPVDNSPSPLRDAVERTQAVLWAVSNNSPPNEFAAAVQKIRDSGELRANINTLKEEYRAPNGGGNAETAFKNAVFDDTRKVASILRILEEELKLMEDAGKMKKDAPKRWQANYDFMLARLKAQIAYVYEYSSMLGSLRKEFPPRDPAVHTGWRLASRKKMQGDGEGRKQFREAEKILDKLATDHADTPWEILAKREKFTALGLEWKPN